MFLRISLLLSGVCLLICNAHVLPEIPNCVFEDTVNLTASTKFANGSYLYEGLLVPPQLTGVYDYIELYDGERKQVKSHVRGCVCQLKKCVKFCCHPRADMYRLSRDSPSLCAEELNEELKYSPYVNVTLHNSSRVLMHVLDEFVVQQGIPCEGGYMLMPHMYEEDQWELREDGTLYRLADAALLSRRDYCLQSYAVGDTYVLNPMNCPATFDEPPTIMLNSMIMLISLPFLYITVLIYWFIPELWNLHSKCLICYLLSLAIGTTLIVVVNFRGAEFETVTCAIIGFVAYYFLSAVFYWLNVICYDVWQNFCRSKGNVQHLTQRKQFMYYSLYGWGLPALMTVITIGLQYSNLPLKLKSGIGYSHCWLKTHDWSAMIYFYGPCLLLIIFNIIIFFLTIKKVYKIRNEMNTLADTKDSRRKLRSQTKKYVLLYSSIWLFFRLFTVMGIGWLLEIIGYIVGNNSDYTIIFQITDVYNAAQGLIIFAILVLKKKVLLLIKKRIMCIKSSNATDSAESQCSEEEIALQSITNDVPQILK
ncbi:G-protein coupled receptor Mth2 isoform X2 [Zeugodacus cucurbitae]|uniref:G-protein coupled receptor Mth2 isoform X2 n=1 Tax=Zeugodacus cucurbitae TaxID=28588 RepID=UPI0023D950A0|nr:G-protein coupled receptor Mth2 isoform X2 [Zeugodacus cucurbitae]